MEAQAQTQSALTHHVRQEVISGQAQYLGPLPATQPLRLDIVLPLRDQAGLDKFLRELGDPLSPSYRHFLTVSEFTTQFGPSEEDYNALTRYATSNGLSEVGGSRDGMDLQVEGPVAAIETAFNMHMGVYQHPTEDRTFYAPDREPTAGLPFPLWHISGLDNYSIPHPMLVRKSDYAKAHGIDPETLVSHATTGSGPSNSFLGSDMRAAYYGGTALTGRFLLRRATVCPSWWTPCSRVSNSPYRSERFALGRKKVKPQTAVVHRRPPPKILGRKPM